MRPIIADLLMRMAEYESGNAHQLQHSLKVYAFASLIARREGLDDGARLTVEAAAVVHDVGIKIAKEKYGSGAGSLQEKEGPAPARELLAASGFDEPIINRVCWLVAHHHTLEPVGGIDHQILLEADFLVNLHEGATGADGIRRVLGDVFRTQTGIALLKTQFALA